MGQDLQEQPGQSIEKRKQRRNRLLSRIGLLFLVLSLGSFGISSAIEIYPTLNPHPAPSPIIGPVSSPTPTPTAVPTPNPTVTPTPNPIVTLTPNPIVTLTPILTPTVTPTPNPGLTITVNPMSLDPSNTNCLAEGTSWQCTVTVGETADSQGNANWSATSDLQVAFVPAATGQLTPGSSTQVTITDIPCQNGSFTFVGAEGEAPVVVSWSCTPIQVNEIAAPTPTPQAPENQLVSDTTIPNIKIVSAWPHMALGQSVDITVSLVTKSYLKIQLTATSSNESNPTQVVSELTPIGTPGLSISNAFGPGYTVSAEAQLYATAFDIQPGRQTQALDQHIVSFKWNVLPKQFGRQNIDVIIMGLWTSQDGRTMKERLIGEPTLSIDVDENKVTNSEPFFVFGQITFGEVLLGFLGSVLNVPWLLDFSRKRREEKSKKQLRTPGMPTIPPKLKGQAGKKKR